MVDWPDSFNRTHDFRFQNFDFPPFFLLFSLGLRRVLSLLLLVTCLRATGDVTQERDWIRSFSFFFFLAMMDHGDRQLWSFCFYIATLCLFLWKNKKEEKEQKIRGITKTQVSKSIVVHIQTNFPFFLFVSYMLAVLHNTCLFVVLLFSILG